MFKAAMLALDLPPAEEPLLDFVPELLHWEVRRLVIVHLVRAGYLQGRGYRQREEATAWLDWRSAPLRAAGLQLEVTVRKTGVSAAPRCACARALAGRGCWCQGPMINNSRPYCPLHGEFHPRRSRPSLQGERP